MHTVVLSKHRVEEEPRLVSWIQSLFPECHVLVVEMEGSCFFLPSARPEKECPAEPQTHPKDPSREFNISLIKHEYAASRL